MLVTVVPGADMALVTRQVLVGGTGRASGPSSATCVGWWFHGVALAAGLSALLASAAAYTAVKSGVSSADDARAGQSALLPARGT